MINEDVIINLDDLILITGSNGFVGSKLVERLLCNGFRNIRCLVRPSSNLNNINKIISSFDQGKVEIVEGNLLSFNDCKNAIEGVSVIYHLAVGVDKTFPGTFMNSVIITKNLLDSIVQGNRVKRFLNVSSFAVYSNFKLNRGALIDETCELESKFVERYEPYCFAKIKQEELVIKYSREYNIPYVIVRPGVVFGPGRSSINGRVGIGTFGIFLHLGGLNRIPFTYIDNCADAIVLAGIKKKVDCEIFNIVDDNLPTSRAFLKMYKKNVGHFKSIYIPYKIFYFLCYLWEKYSKLSQEQLPPVFNRRRCAASWKGNQYSNKKLKCLLGWKPKISFEETLMKYFEYCRNVKGKND